VLISIIKEGVEDTKRHDADAKVNARMTKIINQENGNVEEVEWKDLVVGSVCLLQGDDEIPADILLLTCGGIQGETAYVETMAIDGETNLKIR
jgi:P-type E1-E2 ATPase